jgi:CRISPR/Cas system-associated exonuclease Cas4 (RecB family)
MQNSFLKIAAKRILENAGNDLATACIVFPTRRAALFFRKELAGLLNKPVWAPEILSINDLIASLSSLQTSENIPLLFHLFKFYREEFPGEPFNKFFHWGEMMLRDFNEMDLECVDAGKLFKAVHELKELESMFEWEPEEWAAIKKFWGEFSAREDSLIRKAFFDSWNAFHRIYNRFHQTAAANQPVSEGMAWNQALVNTENNPSALKWNKFYFCGFYFLTRIHERLIEALKKKADVEFLFDADSYYVDDPVQEAGMAFRKMKESSSFYFKGDYFSSYPKSITITGVPMGEMQVKTAGKIIRDWLKEGDEKSIAIVLPDEKLLLPLLNSLPEEVKHFNVTMGFPAHDTVTGSFIRTLYDLYSLNPSSDEFYSRLLLPVLTHPGIPPLYKERAAMLHQIILEKQLYRITAQQVKEALLDELLIIGDQSATGVLMHLCQILKLNAESESGFESKVAAFIYEQLSGLKPSFEELEKEMDFLSAWKVVLKIIKSLRIPFSGEPVAGIQILGMLETRALDFDRLIILSVNEGVLPANAVNPSFIPYSFRKAFGLPVAEQHDAVYAYHFYRLLQRAGEVHLIYDTEGKKFTGGEMSRFAAQLLYEAEKKSNGKCKVSHQVMVASLEMGKDEKIVISKSESMMTDFINTYSAGGRILSASALTAYIACKLRFYFRYIAGLKEPDEFSEVPGAEVLGNLLHFAMEYLYGDKKQISHDEINDMKNRIEQALDVAFQKVMKTDKPEITGFHFLNRQIVKRLVKNVLETDSQRIPFSIEGTERNLVTEINGSLRAGGVIDRIQKKDGVLEILDYKSGKAKLTVEMEKIFTDPDYKASFQMFFYVMLVKKHLKEQAVKAGLYIMHEWSGEISFLNEGGLIGDSLSEEFESRLQNMVNEILDYHVPFTQTEERQRCRFCAYAAICKR